MTPALDAEAACRLLHETATLLREDPNRKGALLEFGGAGQVVMTGDLHGNLKNFEKLQRFCALERSPGRSVVLHELIHADIENAGEMDLSIDLLLRAAQWKCDFPDNVFFLQSNHELAQLRKQEITKGGRSVLYDFERGVEFRFGREAGPVLEAINDYIAALPLAARTRNGVLMSHSLPDPMLLDTFDASLFERELTPDDLEPGGAAYALVWGRFHSADSIAMFTDRLGLKCCIVGHTPQENGSTRVGRLIILASEHNHGSFLPIDLSSAVELDELESNIRKFVSVE